MSDPIQTIFPDVSPALLVLEKEVGLGDLGQEDVKVVIIHLNPSHRIKIRSSVDWALGEKGPVALRNQKITNLTVGDSFFNAKIADLCS